MCSHCFSLVWVAGWPPFGKWLLARLAMCSHCILTITGFDFSRSGFRGWVWVLIASVPELCILFTFSQRKISSECQGTAQYLESKENIQ